MLPKWNTQTVTSGEGGWRISMVVMQLLLFGLRMTKLMRLFLVETHIVTRRCTYSPSRYLSLCMCWEGQQV
ncbi:hypothetical protein ACHWQZ_G003217 [Mnemiopsis leidyi]